MDIIIKNGLVVDGTGEPARRADVAIYNGRIRDIDESLGDHADEIINAEGMVIAPGFVDILNHADTYLTLLKNPSNESLLAQGVTTIAIGNCGASLAPMTHGRLISVVQKWADVREMNIDWQRFSEFLEVIERFRPGVNVLGLVGHTTIRRDILNDEFRDPTEEELGMMVHLLEEAMDEGAFGLSYAPSYAHARVAPEWEIDALAQVVARKGGLFSMHLRNEREKMAEATNEAIAIAKRASVSMEISHLKAVGDEAGNEYPVAIKAIDEAVKEGVNINFNVFPFEEQHAVLYLLFPDWAQEGGFNELRKRLKDETIKKKIVDEMAASNIPWDDYIVAEASRGKSAVGKTLTELGRHTESSPAESAVNLFLAHEGRVLLFHRCKGPSHLKDALAHQGAHIVSAGGGYSLDDVSSGALVHPRSFGAFPEFLGRYIRDEDLLSLEKAVQKITGGPAKKLGLSSRGTLKQGGIADVVIFNPKTVKNRATIDKPYQYPEGIKWVLVNGKVAINPNGITGKRAGEVLRRSS